MTTVPATGPRRKDRSWRSAAAGGSGLLLALSVALVAPGHAAIPLVLAACGLLAALVVLLPRVLAAVQRSPVPLVAATLAVAGISVLVLRLTGVAFVSVSSDGYGVSVFGDQGRTLLPIVLMALTAFAGLVLTADGARVGAARRRAPWDSLTNSESGQSGAPLRMVAGVLLIGVAGAIAIGLINRSSDSPTARLLLGILVAGAAAIMIAAPLLISSLTRVDRDLAADARAEERQRFAAHLHDSVLQTLALVQRQAHDPVAVARLARRQEHALRSWMAGESDLLGETLVAALRDVVAEVEDEQSITVEMTAIGDRPIEAAGEALVAATREALRNAARHAGRPAAILVFAEISPGGVAVFVRDQGAGFEPAAVPPERRGIRDAIVGRMASAGGEARIESAPGQGTEVALRIGGPQRVSGGRG